MKRLSLAGLLCLTIAPALAAEGPKRPNVILIIADDMAWDDSGAFGHPKIRTPNLDGLARGGMRFDRAFVTASSCSPSRSSLITGRYPHSTDAEELHWPLPAEQVTFVEKLRGGRLLDGRRRQVAPGQPRQDEVRPRPRGQPGGLPARDREGRRRPG